MTKKVMQEGYDPYGAEVRKHWVAQRMLRMMDEFLAKSLEDTQHDAYMHHPCLVIPIVPQSSGNSPSETLLLLEHLSPLATWHSGDSAIGWGRHLLSGYLVLMPEGRGDALGRLISFGRDDSASVGRAGHQFFSIEKLRELVGYIKHGGYNDG